MATLDDARRIALALPGAAEKSSWGHAFWHVGNRGFVWERPLGRKDLEELGGTAPDGEILGVRVADEGEKQALVEGEPERYFTISHFDGYSAVLLRLEAVTVDELTEIVTDAWLDRAPTKLRAAFLADREG